MDFDYLNNADSIILCIDGLETTKNQKLKKILIEKLKKLKITDIKIMLVAFDSAWYYIEKGKKFHMKQKCTFEEIEKLAANTQLDSLNESCEKLIDEINDLNRGGGGYIWTALTFCLFLACNPNSHLVIFTDGVTQDPNLEEYAKLFYFLSANKTLKMNIDLNVTNKNNCHPKLIELIRTADGRIKESSDFESIFNEREEQENVYRNSFSKKENYQKNLKSCLKTSNNQFNTTSSISDTMTTATTTATTESIRETKTTASMFSSGMDESTSTTTNAKRTTGKTTGFIPLSETISKNEFTQKNGFSSQHTEKLSCKEEINKLKTKIENLVDIEKRKEKFIHTQISTSNQTLESIKIEILNYLKYFKRNDNSCCKEELSKLKTEINNLSKIIEQNEKLIFTEINASKQTFESFKIEIQNSFDYLLNIYNKSCCKDEINILKTEVKRLVDLLKRNENLIYTEINTCKQTLERIKIDIQKSFEVFERNDKSFCIEEINKLKMEVNGLVKLLEKNEKLIHTEINTTKQSWESFKVNIQNSFDYIQTKNDDTYCLEEINSLKTEVNHLVRLIETNQQYSWLDVYRQELDDLKIKINRFRNVNEENFTQKPIGKIFYIIL